MRSGHFGVHGNDPGEHLAREQNRNIERQYAEILTTLGRAAAMSGTHSAGAVLAEAGKAMRRIASGLHIGPPGEPAPASAIYRVTYVSFAAERQASLLLAKAREIARASALRNSQDGITGALSVGGGWFAQVLEGPIRPLIACFDRILADSRHSDSRVLDFDEVDCRLFADWSMAYSGEIAPNLVRQSVVDYVAQERHGENSASTSARALVAAMAGNAKSL